MYGILQACRLLERRLAMRRYDLSCASLFILIGALSELRRRAVKLREQVAHACKSIGRAPPSPPPAEFGTVRY